MAISKIVNNVDTLYICSNTDEKPIGAIPGSKLWVYDVNTWFMTPGIPNTLGNPVWVQVEGNNSIFTKP